MTFWGFQFRTVPLRIPKETTFLTAPLALNGKSVDYFRYAEENFGSDRIAVESNGIREVIRRFGLSGLGIENSPEFESLCKRLKIDPEAIIGDLDFEGPHSFLERYVSSKEFDTDLAKKIAVEAVGQSRAREIFSVSGIDLYDINVVLENRIESPWLGTELPMMKDWLNRNSPAMDFFQQATKQEFFELPFVRSDKHRIFPSVVLTGSTLFRPMARAFSVRANYRIGLGDIDGAIENLMTVNHAARRFQRHPKHVGIRGELAMEAIANRVGIAGNSKANPSREQLSNMLQMIDKLPLPNNIDEYILIERFLALGWLGEISEGKNTVSGFHDWKTLVMLGVDWNHVARKINSAFDSPDFLTRRRHFRKTRLLDYLILTRRSDQVARYFISIIQGGLLGEIDARYRTSAGQKIRQISLAMLRYEKDHGTLPPAFTVGKDGKPLHSWRTLILPYLGHQELFDEIRFDEPWNSEHNRRFSEIDVPVFRNPDPRIYKKGATNYSVVIGPDFAFSGAKGNSLEKFGPNSQHMTLVVERNKPILWMDPSKELTLEHAKRGMLAGHMSNSTTKDRIGGLHDSSVVLGRRDGSAIASYVPVEQLMEMLNGTYRRKLY